MSPRRSSYHDCHKHYELKKYKRFFKCDGCKMQGFGERYKCSLCGNYLHRECRYPRSEDSHEKFPGSIFKFHSEPFTRRGENNRREFSKSCDACGKVISGFNYHCKEDNFDLHPCCRKLENKVVIERMIFDLVTEASSKCVKCGKRKISCDVGNVQGWSYVSQCKRFTLHVYCMSEMIQEAHMKGVDSKKKNMDSGELLKYNRNGKGENTFITSAKLVIKILFSVFLGDPTTLISNSIVEFLFLPLRL